MLPVEPVPDDPRVPVPVPVPVASDGGPDPSPIDAEQPAAAARGSPCGSGLRYSGRAVGAGLPARRGSQAAKSGPAGWGGFASWLVIARATRFGSGDDHFFLIPIRIVRISLGCVPGSSPIPSMLRARALRRLLPGAAMPASLTWATRGHTEPAKCPRSNGAWIDLQFSGAGWSISQQESILHELRIELNRRYSKLHSWRRGLCLGPERGGHAGFRRFLSTAFLSSPPGFEMKERSADARYASVRFLRRAGSAVAQAVDEALRGVRPAPEPPPPAPAPPAPVTPTPTHEVSKPGQRVPDIEPPPQGHPSPLRLAVSLGPSLQWAPTKFTSASNTLAVPGAALRVAITSGCCGGSLGVLFGPFERPNVRFGVDLSVSCPGRRFPSLWPPAREIPAHFDLGSSSRCFAKSTRPCSARIKRSRWELAEASPCVG